MGNSLRHVLPFQDKTHGLPMQHHDSSMQQPCMHIAGQFLQISVDSIEKVSHQL